MSYKQVYRYSEIREKIHAALDILSEPIRETMGPKGSNVLFETSTGAISSSNDGATIARSISVKDPVVNAIIEVVKGASLKTNVDAGDGTSTTILLSSILVREGLKLIDDGMNRMDVKAELQKFAEAMIAELKKGAIKLKGREDMLRIATISANNDRVIAEDVVRAVEIAGLDGMVFIEPHNKKATEVIEEAGFHIPSGMLIPDLKTEANRFVADYQNVPVLITDKRIYYKEEVDSILNAVLTAGYREVVVVARDFIGESLGQFMANHNKGIVKCLLIKDTKADGTNNESLEDLAIYLGGHVVSEKDGSIVTNLTHEDFCFAGRVFADHQKTLVTPKVKGLKAVKARIKALKAELEKDEDDEEIKRRISSLTNGMVKIRVGGSTPIEINEKIYRFDDAINAVRKAVVDGYLPGGGTSINSAFRKIEKSVRPEFRMMFRKYAQANIRQIAENCGKHQDTIMELVDAAPEGSGYNAMEDRVENLSKAGVIDPFKVSEMAVANSVSVAVQLLSSRHLIIIDREDNEEKK